MRALPGPSGPWNSTIRPGPKPELRILTMVPTFRGSPTLFVSIAKSLALYPSHAWDRKSSPRARSARQPVPVDAVEGAAVQPFADRRVAEEVVREAEVDAAHLVQPPQLLLAQAHVETAEVVLE